MVSTVKDINIIGAGHTRFGRLDENLEGLISLAVREALVDADIPAGEVDAVFVGHFNAGLVRDGFVASLVHQADEGFRFTPATRLENACASGSAAIHAGIESILSGRAQTVLVVGVEKMSARRTSEVTESLASAGYQNDSRESALSFPEVFAHLAREYATRYGDPMLAMAQIASKNHQNAMHNPLAQMHREISVEDCMAITDRNPLIAPPLRLTDCSLVSDGAAALILTSARIVARRDRAARFLSAVQVNDTLPFSGRDLVLFEGPQRAIQKAYEDGGISLDDLSFAEVHDCFTIAELLIYEAMGLAPAGQGATVLDSGRVMRDGRTPVNVSGGLKAKGHPVGATGVSMHVMAYRQLIGQAGDMQLDKPELGLVFNMGGAAVANYASVLARV